MSKLFQRLFRKRMVSIDTYLNHDFYCPEMRSYELVYLPDEMRFPDPILDKQFKWVQTPQKIQPPRLAFNMNAKQVKQKLGRPFLTINNDKNISGSRIFLYKRRIGEYKTTTQVHVINNQLKLVVEQFSKIYINQVSFLHQIIRSLGLETTSLGDKGTLTDDKESGPPDSLVFQDPAGNIAHFDESITINVYFQTK